MGQRETGHKGGKTTRGNCGLRVVLRLQGEVVGAVGSLLTSPCFRKGLRTAVVMEHAGCHHYMFYRGEPDGTPVLFPVA
jgi:hypothetical protein